MDILALVASFGGGVIGAYLGGVPVFIMTGLLSIIGAVLNIAGATGAGGAVLGLAFGSFIGPHIAFAGGAAAAAYAGSKGKLSSGTDIVSSLNGLNAPDVLVVGGIFGVLGFVLNYVISLTPLGSGMFGTDLPGICVVISGIIARLAFGKTGLMGKYTGTGPRTYLSTGTALNQNLIMGAGIGIATSFCLASLVTGMIDSDPITAALLLGNFNLIAFGFAAMTLVFTCIGLGTPGTHHIAIISAYAAMIGIMKFGAYGMLMGVVFGIIAALWGDVVGNTFNSHCDTHIDPPAMTIFPLTIVLNIIANI